VDQTVTTNLRVVNAQIKGQTPEGGDVLEIRAIGEWISEDGHSKYPLSIHIGTYPGCGLIPHVGDHIKVIIERQ
jgi:hypothetical protein